MARRQLTVRSVEQLKPDRKRRREIPDSIDVGLYLVIQPSGTKSWALRYKFHGKSRKATLAKSYPQLGLLEARVEVRKLKALVAEGRDPARERRDDRAIAKAGADTVEAVVERFLASYTKRDGTVPRSLPETRRLLEREVVPQWRGRRIGKIKRRDVIDLLDTIKRRGVGVTANRVLAVVRRLFGWLQERDEIEVSPVTGVRARAPEVKRDRVLTDAEVAGFWKATGELGYPFGPLVRMLLVTGQRLGEVAGMSWSEIDLDKAIWKLPPGRTKNARAHVVPLSDLALEIIESLPKIAGERGLLFTTNGESPSSGFSRAKATLDAVMARDGGGLPPWRLHDLRRTMASGLASVGVDIPVVERCLNHVSGSFAGIVGVYQHHPYEVEKRAAMQAWANRLREIAGERPARDNVVALRSTVEA
jgi:integrase